MKEPRHVKTLDVVARTRAAHDPKTYEHAVTLRLDDDYKWILRIEGTPGSWFLETILLSYPPPESAPACIRVHETMWIDTGQGWYVENWREVLGAALTAI